MIMQEFLIYNCPYLFLFPTTFFGSAAGSIAPGSSFFPFLPRIGYLGSGALASCSTPSSPTAFTLLFPVLAALDCTFPLFFAGALGFVAFGGGAGSSTSFTTQSK